MVSVINENGCSGQASVTVVVEFPPCEDPYVFLPNAFTPNGDGINDVLFVRGEHVEVVRLEIYNRWGQLVFETTDQSVGWDGLFKGAPAPQEVYGFILEVNCIGGQQYKTQGNISLFR
jgi:gliding motility-associated-like protein